MIAPGDVLLDCYQIDPLLAREGTPFLARDRRLSRHVAIDAFRVGPADPAAAGLFGCAVLAFSVPTASIVSSATVLGVRAVIWLIRNLRGRSTELR